MGQRVAEAPVERGGVSGCVGRGDGRGSFDPRGSVSVRDKSGRGLGTLDSKGKGRLGS